MCACATIVALALLLAGGAAADQLAPATPWTPRVDERYELVFMSSRQHAGKLIAGAFVQSFADARANPLFAPLFARLAPGPAYALESAYSGTTLGALHAMTERYLLGRRSSQLPRQLILAFFGTASPFLLFLSFLSFLSFSAFPPRHS